MGCSPWGRYESDTTEQLHFHFSLSCIGEGNGNRLQCSCLENPRDGGAWWAAVCGVAQSRTRLKRLSSSSSHMSNHVAQHLCGHPPFTDLPCHTGRYLFHICMSLSLTPLICSIILFTVATVPLSQGCTVNLHSGKAVSLSLLFESVLDILGLCFCTHILQVACANSSKKKNLAGTFFWNHFEFINLFK